jgi:hypothetical protein
VAKVYGRKLVNGAAARHVETQRALRKVASETASKARGNLAMARSSTPWDKIADPDGLTRIGWGRGTGKYGAVDFNVWMEAYKQGAMALEFGHAPSGVFGEGGSLGHIKTRAPHGLYILTRAAGLGAKMSVSSGKKRGKR